MLELQVSTCLLVSVQRLNNNFFLLVSNFAVNYHYRAYLENLLHYDSESKKCQLSTVGWCLDTVGQFDSIDNEGWQARRAKFIQYDQDAAGAALDKDIFRDSPVTYYGPLLTNLENCKQGLIPNTECTIEIFWNNPDFCIWQPPETLGDYMLKIEYCYIEVYKGTLNWDILNRLEAELASKAAMYHYR